MQFLAAWSDGELVPKLFACPSNAGVKPPDIDTSVVLNSGSTSGITWDATNTGYAYDPSVPSAAKATRVVLADRRSLDSLSPHKKVAIAVYGDGHVGNCNREGSSDAYHNSDASGPGGADNIFDDSNDSPNMNKRGLGSSTRAYVR
jgi:hypothetical protein